MLLEFVFELVMNLNIFPPGINAGIIIGIIIVLLLVSLGVVAWIAYTIYAIIRNRSFSFDDDPDSELTEEKEEV